MKTISHKHFLFIYFGKYFQLLSSGLTQTAHPSDKTSILGFTLGDIYKELRRGKRLVRIGHFFANKFVHHVIVIGIIFVFTVLESSKRLFHHDPLLYYCGLHLY